jgi:hypothetical protein
MQASLMVIDVMALVLIGFALIGGPMILMDWLRRRRQEAIERQVELTEALDGRFGTMVAPVVTKPLFGPWEIRFAVPLPRSAVTGEILSEVDDLFCGAEGRSASNYRIVLSAKPGLLTGTRAPRSTTRWSGGPFATPDHTTAGATWQR